MGKIFLSYRRADVAQVRALARALRHAGLRPWRDEDDLDVGVPTEEQIRDALAGECDTAVLWLSPEALESGYVMRVELPAILKAARAGRLGFVPVLVGMSLDAAEKAVLERTGESIQGYHGVVADPGEDPAALAQRVAASAVRARLRRAGLEGAAGAPVIRAVTRDDTARGRSEAVLDFDWRDAYRDDQIPDAAIQRDLKTALKRSTGELFGAWPEVGEIRLELKTHLSVAFAFGHAFHRATGAVPVVRHYDGTWWKADAGAAGPELVHDLDHGLPDSSELAIEVSLTNDVTRCVRALVQDRGRPFRAHLRFRPERGRSQTSVPDDQVANAWARQIRERTLAAVGEFGADEIALFVSAPLPFAVLLGWWSSVLGPLTVYDWGSGGPYRPGWTVP